MSSLKKLNKKKSKIARWYLKYFDWNDDGATIKMKVPGFNKKSIDISVDSETLTIEGKTDDDSFVKRFSIDNKFDFDSIDAKVIDGLLTLSIPYKAEVKPRKIKVN